ncbi:SMR family transporter [Pseudohoeflea coraliihabitans]|uniref:EamA family transporter n=1 Tax=Pseudohoeflea coraliihabitans TaxID=2860393 RepID=A0ABS6WK10_9HYPH|nr:SMR family transporter [Pseudohoeflea sp. DP4N28-3]MBW3096110.1 EamA family transporter [Pseudohoeflea sp. DP4N28-3]
MNALVVNLVLLVAIAAEVVATTALARSDGFTRLWPSLIAGIGYAFAIWLLAYALRFMPAGIVYAVWSGAGIVLIALVAWLLYGQTLDLPAIIGIALIIAGVAILNLWSDATLH